MYTKTRAEGFGAEVKRRILVGTYVLSHGYYDAYYLQAQKVRRLIADDFQQAFEQCDVIAGPVAPTRRLGARRARPTTRCQMYLADIFTLPAILAGLPGMSIPCGFGAARPAGRPAADRQLLRRGAAAATPRTASSRRPTGTCARRQASDA